MFFLPRMEIPEQNMNLSLASGVKAIENLIQIKKKKKKKKKK